METPIDKAKLANIVFHDEKQRKKLEDILHPLVFDEISKQKQLNNEHILFLDIPLLFESNYKEFDESILIDTTEALQLDRLMKRNKYTQEEALVRIKAQIPLSKKRKLATHIIKNNGSIDALYEKIDKLLERYV